MPPRTDQDIDERTGFVGRCMGFLLYNPIFVALLLVALLLAGGILSPFRWSLGSQVGVRPVAVDAIPDLGENQQIVFTEWPGRSPRDVEDQLTYPLTSALLGLQGVKSVRSTSMFGFSSIYVIFEEGIGFYESRTRLLEKLSSLREGTDYPIGARPQLGPDATALGQVFWYTLEGRDPDGNLTGGWDLEELRSIQDWYVRQGLLAAEGVSEVGSVGGFVREYQVDVDPDRMRYFGVTLREVYAALRESNLDISAKTVELNRVEYFVRGVGFARDVADLESAVVKTAAGVPITLDQLATVTLGPASRRGALDKDGAEAVGGVVVARFGANPLQTIQAVKQRITQIQPGLDRKVLLDTQQVSPAQVERYAAAHGFVAYDAAALQQDAFLAHLDATPREDWPAWATISQATIVPFYDRSELIRETLGTLNTALYNQILVTFVVVILMVLHLRSSVLIGGMMPLAVAFTFIAMTLFDVDANIVALSGIAIAIGTIVDMGIVLCENCLRHLDEADDAQPRRAVIHRAVSEVGGAVLTAGLTTILGFLPIFALAGKAGKLFQPLAFTKTFALLGSVLVALLILPTGAWLLFRKPSAAPSHRRFRILVRTMLYTITLAVAVLLLTRSWMPLSARNPLWGNLLFVGMLLFGLVGLFRLFQWAYPTILAWCLRHKAAFLSIPVVLLLLAGFIWFGFERLAAPPARAARVETFLKDTNLWQRSASAFPGLGREFMPPLDEGAFLWMPILSQHGSIAEALDILSKQDTAMRALPEVDRVVGKVGRVDSPLDPAPLTMIETLVTYKPEYRMENGEMVRQWRQHIRTPDDIWDELVRVAKVPGANVPSKGYPIQIRQVMLQTGMTANMGVKVFGPSLEAIEPFADAVGKALENIDVVVPASINVDRVVGKPYLVIDTTGRDVRRRMQRHGLNAADVLDVVEAAIGGRRITTTVEGQERYAVRVRYPRERRDTVAAMENILIPTPTGQQVPLADLTTFTYQRGPQMIKSENARKVAYITFDTVDGVAEVEAAETIQRVLRENIQARRLTVPRGVGYQLAGQFRNEQRANQRLMLLIPAALSVMFLLLYLQFRSLLMASLIFTGVAVAFSGGFLLLWLYGRTWFLDVEIAGESLRHLFQVGPVNLSTAIWVGFLALFGIATDDGVVMGTYLQQTFGRREPETPEGIRQAVVTAGSRRVRACLMTTATTLLALLPVLTSTGRGSDIMAPMAIPIFGGMAIEVLTMLVVPVLYCLVREKQQRLRGALSEHASES